MCKSKGSFIDHQLEVAAEVARNARPNHFETVSYLRGQGKRLTFIDQQIKLHQKAEDILMVIKKCRKKLKDFESQLRQWTPDLSLYSKQELEYKVSWQRFVLIRLTGYYTKQVTMTIERVMSETDVDILFTDKKPAA